MAPAPPNQQARPLRVDRLTVNLPAGTLTALKVHVAQRGTTIREVVTELVQTALTEGENRSSGIFNPEYRKKKWLTDEDIAMADPAIQANVNAWAEEAMRRIKLKDAGAA